MQSAYFEKNSLSNLFAGTTHARDELLRSGLAP